MLMNVSWRFTHFHIGVNEQLQNAPRFEINFVLNFAM